MVSRAMVSSAMMSKAVLLIERCYLASRPCPCPVPLLLPLPCAVAREYFTAPSLPASAAFVDAQGWLNQHVARASQRVVRIVWVRVRVRVLCSNPSRYTLVLVHTLHTPCGRCRSSAPINS